MGKKSPPPAPHGAGIRDRRKWFERMSRQSGRDEVAERAFIENKMEIVRTDPTLTDEQKRIALDELRRKLKPPR
jgi:hypothetical protein